MVLACCVVLRVREKAGLEQFPVALAWGKHLFPFRTEQLSPKAPMVLGLRGPGRVGRRRFFTHEPPTGRLVVVSGFASRAPAGVYGGWVGMRFDSGGCRPVLVFLENS